MNSAGGGVWSPEMIVVVRENYGRSDQSAATIAALLNAMVRCGKVAWSGNQITRNAVVGKAHRMGLKGRDQSIVNAEHKANRRVAPSARTAPRVALPPAREIPPQHAPVGVSAPTGVGIADLGPGMCRYPFGDPRAADFCFCASATLGGGVYCSDHARITRQSEARSDCIHRRTGAAVLKALTNT